MGLRHGPHPRRCCCRYRLLALAGRPSSTGVLGHVANRGLCCWRSTGRVRACLWREFVEQRRRLPLRGWKPSFLLVAEACLISAPLTFRS